MTHVLAELFFAGVGGFAGWVVWRSLRAALSSAAPIEPLRVSPLTGFNRLSRESGNV